ALQTPKGFGADIDALGSSAWLCRSLCVVGARRTIESAPFEQGFDVGIAADEILKQVESVRGAAARQQRGAKAVAILAFQSAVLLEPLDCVGVEHLAPDIRVITGRVPAGE